MQFVYRCQGVCRWRHVAMTTRTFMTIMSFCLRAVRNIVVEDGTQSYCTKHNQMPVGGSVPSRLIQCQCLYSETGSILIGRVLLWRLLGACVIGWRRDSVLQSRQPCRPPASDTVSSHTVCLWTPVWHCLLLAPRNSSGSVQDLAGTLECWVEMLTKLCLLTPPPPRLNSCEQSSDVNTTVLWLFFQDHPGEPVPEENFWTLWCKGRLTEADTPTIRLNATPSGLTSAHLHHSPHFFTGRMPFLLPNQRCQSTEDN